MMAGRIVHSRRIGPSTDLIQFLEECHRIAHTSGIAAIDVTLLGDGKAVEGALVRPHGQPDTLAIVLLPQPELVTPNEVRSRRERAIA